MNKSNAVVITAGYLDTYSGKTAHGLIRGTDRFNIVGIIDHKFSGRDAGEILDGKNRGIQIYASLDEFVTLGKQPAKYVILGVATKGGVIPESLQVMLKDALTKGFSIVNGLHDYVSEHADLAELAKRKGLEIIDVRKPKKFKDLHFWVGDIKRVQCPKIAVLGTDCALGKRTTTRILVEAMRQAGFKAEMIYTGQTGWMQGARYGFIFDSTLNDFISGEMEHAVVTCWDEAKPDIIFIEGQSSLRNPSGPAGAEWLISAATNGVVLQHHPIRKQYKDFEYYPAYLPEIQDEVALIKAYGVPTLALTLNTGKMTEAEARTYSTEKEKELGIPVILPLEDGVEQLVPVFRILIEKSSVKI